MTPARNFPAALILGALLGIGAARPALAQCPPDALLHAVPNPLPAPYDYFGASVAISGNRLVASSFRSAADGPADSGTAHVVNAIYGNRIATLINPDPTAQDYFGFSVEIDGDLAIVGAPGDAPAGVDHAGSAYVFNAATGALVATLTAPTPAAGESFGYAVAISGNLAVVGADLASPGGVQAAGAAYLFNATSGALLATLTSPAPLAFDNFGASVAISGNVIAVGAPQSGNPSLVWGAGVVYLFDATTGLLTTTINNPSFTAGDLFGAAIALSGGGIIVGAPYTNPGVVKAGAAYIFDTANGALVAPLTSPFPVENEGFGGTVAISDGFAVVGALGADPGGVEGAGIAYLFDAATGTFAGALNNPSPTYQDFFGASVAASGNIIAVGAYGDSPGEVAAAGSVTTFTCADDVPNVRRELGDFDGNGCSDLADFTFLLDNWREETYLGSPEVGMPDFLNLIDNWQTGPQCVG